MTAERKFVPFEMITCESYLDGSDGIFRRQAKNPLQLQNDIHAAQEWLETKASRPSTYKAYQNSLDILFNWAIFSRKKAFSSFEPADFADFDLYMSNPGLWDPPARQSSVERGSPCWRPIYKPRSVSSRSVVLRCLASLTSWLGKVDYAHMQLRPAPSFFDSSTATSLDYFQSGKERQEISLDEWKYICDSLDMLPGPNKEAFTLLLYLLYYADLTITEATSLKFDDFKNCTSVNIPPSINLPNRREKESRIYLIPEICEKLGLWLSTRSSTTTITLGDRGKYFQMYAKLKTIAAQQARKSEKYKIANELETSAPKNLRHAFASHIIGTIYADDAWILSAVTIAPKSYIFRYLPIRPNLSMTEYAEKCQRISDFIQNKISAR
jgi:integrase